VNGSPDVVLFNLLLSLHQSNLPALQTELAMDPADLKIGMGKLAKNKLISVEKKTKQISLTQEALDNQDKYIVDITKDVLILIHENSSNYKDTVLDPKTAEEFKKLKLTTSAQIKVCKIKKGASFSLEQTQKVE